MASGPSSSKRLTISGIADEAGVSTAAVSYALNGLPGVSADTRQRILVVADRMGWRPNIAARSLSVAKAHAVGLVIARPADTLGVEPFFMRFISGVERELARAGFALVLQVVDDHRSWNATVQAWWAERRVDGVIVTDIHTKDARLPLVQRLAIPAVVVGRRQPRISAPAVWSDDDAAVRAAVDHLAGLGHRRLARVAGLRTFDHTSVRTAAFLSAVAAHGLPQPTVLDTDYSFEAGADATRELLALRRPPTAVIFDNDLMAVAAVNVARDLGVPVPGGLSIVAGDDSPLCLLGTPQVTALSRDVAAYGAQVARTLLEAVDGKRPESVVVATPELVVRASTGAPGPAR